MLFADVVATSGAVGATSSRTAKAQALADLLARAQPEEIEPLVGFLVGEPRQGRVGVGWKTLQSAADSEGGTDRVDDASLSVAEVDQAITDLAGLSGPGSTVARKALLADVFGRASTEETTFLFRLLGGDLRQGALAGVMADAVAKASGVPATVVRRAVMLGGRLDEAARIALTQGRPGLEAVQLRVGRPVQPMLASTATSVTEAVEAMSSGATSSGATSSGAAGASSVEWKLDGIRIQVHRSGDDVVIFTRNLNDITARLSGVVALVRALPVTSVVLDGEALVVDDAGRPVMFQDTASRVGADELATDVAHSAVVPHFFDILHVDGTDLLDAPLAERIAELERVVGRSRIPGALTSDPAEGEQVLADALAAGHEGVVVKASDSRYEAGRRGKAWRKVKPVHTLDLVVLAVEWGYGRRTGWLSNLHLGARADDGSGLVMVGKTFKGMTDDMLRWQTERFLALAEREEPWTGPQTGTVWVRPEQVVEIAVDGVQRSTRYPGGVALRFARVLRYRDDKDPAEADALSSVQALLPR